MQFNVQVIKGINFSKELLLIICFLNSLLPVSKDFFMVIQATHKANFLHNGCMANIVDDLLVLR